MSPRSKQKNDEIRLESKKKIMEAAFRLIAKKGYESASMSQIAAKAGVSKGLLYNYYVSKEELLRQMVMEAFSGGDEQIQGLVSNNPRKTLKNFFRFFFKELRERPDYWRLITELTFKIDKFDFVHQMAVEKINAYTKLFEELLAKIGVKNAKGEARLIAALFDGIGVQYLVIRKNYPLDEIEDYLIKKYCKKKNS